MNSKMKKERHRLFQHGVWKALWNGPDRIRGLQEAREQPQYALDGEVPPQEIEFELPT